jgi:hypothetical protein
MALTRPFFEIGICGWWPSAFAKASALAKAMADKMAARVGARAESEAASDRMDRIKERPRKLIRR